MKKHILAKTVAMTLVALGAAAANAQVSISGSVDAGIARTKAPGISTVTSVESGLKSDNSLAFTGGENLGGGLKANFKLETGFNMDNGTSTGGMFAREASVGVSTQASFAKLGQVKTLSATHNETYDPFAGGLLGNARATFEENGRFAANTAVAGTTMGPVSLTGSWTFGEQAGNVNTGAVKAVSANYGVGPLKVGVTHTDVDNAGTTTQYSAAYDVKGMTVYGTYENDTDRAVNNAYQVGLKTPVAANLNAMVAMGERSLSTGAEEKTFAAGLDYSLSKRTSVYTSYKYVDPAATGKTTTMALGLNHKF
jgi:predicted porin